MLIVRHILLRHIYIFDTVVSVFADGRYGSISNVSQFQNFTCNPDRDSLSACTLLQDCQSTCKYAIGIRCISKFFIFSH